MIFPSKKTLDSQKKSFALLLADDYELKITDLERSTRPRYMKPEETEEIVNITLEVVAYKDGELAGDEEGKEATGRKVFFTARPNSIGFRRDGTPSKTRCLAAYALGFKPEDEFEIEEWEELLGKTIFASIVQYLTQKGDKRNKIDRILPPPRRKGSKIIIDEAEIPVIDETQKTDDDNIPF